MIKLTSKFVAFALTVVLAAPAMAAQSSSSSTDQRTEKDEIATLNVDSGVIMISNGGPFVSAATGQRLFEDTRVMVSTDSKAVIDFDNGCDQTFEDPGVYNLDKNCKAVAWWGGTTGAAIAAAISFGVVGTYILTNRDDGHTILPPPPPPVSR